MTTTSTLTPRKATSIDRKRNVLWFGDRLVIGISLLAMIESTAGSWNESVCIATPTPRGEWLARERSCEEGRWMTINDIMVLTANLKRELGTYFLVKAILKYTRQQRILCGLLN